MKGSKKKSYSVNLYGDILEVENVVHYQKKKKKVYQNSIN